MPDGSAKERDLTNIFRSGGWFARRAASSGGGAKQASYDVMAAKDGTVIVAELKYRDPSAHIYLDQSEIEDLCWCANHLGGDAVVFTRWKRDTTFYGYFPDQLHRTDGGNYRVSVTDREGAILTVSEDNPPTTSII